MLNLNALRVIFGMGMFLITPYLCASTYFSVTFSGVGGDAIFSGGQDFVNKPSSLPAPIGGVVGGNVTMSGATYCNGSVCSIKPNNIYYPFVALYTPFPQVGTYKNYPLYALSPTVSFYIERNLPSVSSMAYVFNGWTAPKCNSSSDPSDICAWFTNGRGTYSANLNTYYPIRYVLTKIPADGVVTFPRGPVLYEWRGVRATNNDEHISSGALGVPLVTYISQVNDLSVKPGTCVSSSQSIVFDHGVLTREKIAGNTKKVAFTYTCDEALSITMGMLPVGHGSVSDIKSKLLLPISTGIDTELTLDVGGNIDPNGNAITYSAIKNIAFPVSIESVLKTSGGVITYGEFMASAVLLSYYD